MELKELMTQASTISSEKGFWDDYHRIIKVMKGLPHHFTEQDIERIKFAFYNEKISLISSELGEATEAVRLGKFFGGGEEGITELKKMLNGESQGMYVPAYITHLKDTFEDEISDSFIRLFDLCEKMEIDIETFIQLKLEYNKSRGVKHGKKF
jgi:NTP pyrophosphatase (non-canonical NTP hydrolase)